MIVNTHALKLFRAKRRLFLLEEDVPTKVDEELMLPDTMAIRDLVQLGWIEEVIQVRLEPTESDGGRQEAKGPVKFRRYEQPLPLGTKPSIAGGSAGYAKSLVKPAVLAEMFEEKSRPMWNIVQRLVGWYRRRKERKAQERKARVMKALQEQIDLYEKLVDEMSGIPKFDVSK